MKKNYQFIYKFGAAVLFVVTINVFAQLPQYFNFNTAGTNNSFPMGISTGKMLQALVVAGELNQPSPAPSGIITKLYYRVNELYPFNNVTYSFIYILMGQANITTLPTGAFYTGTMDTVFKATSYTINAAGGTWVVFNLTTPYVFNNTQGLIIEIGQFGFSGANFFPACNTTLTGNRRSYSVGGPPFVYSGQGAQMFACGVDVAPTTPPHYNFNTTGGDNSFPMNQVAGKMCQWLVAPGEYNQPTPALGGGSITGFYFRISGTYPLGPATYTSFHILFGQTALISLPTGSFYTGTMDTVYSRASVTFQAAVNTWLFIPLDNPFPYNPAQSLVIQVGQCGASGTVSGFSLTHTNLTGMRRCWSVGGCPFVYAGQGVNVVNNGIIIRYPVGVNTNNNQIPGAYKLEQNYPNPFNPVTTINYGLPKGSNVKLTIYDILGREVEVLVNEFRAPGNYSVNFDATNYASGVYLYKLETNGFTDTKKMQLIK